MARRSGSDSAETMESIVAAARQILESDGSSALTFRRVSKSAGVSVGTIAYYFPDRPALVEACLDAHHDWIADELARLVALRSDGASLDTLVDDAVRTIFRAMVANRETLRLRRMRALEHGELASSRRARSLQPALDALGALWKERGAPPTQGRLVGQSMIFLVTRYALLSDAEVTELTGANSADDARQLVEQHLVHTAMGYFNRSL